MWSRPRPSLSPLSKAFDRHLRQVAPNNGAGFAGMLTAEYSKAPHLSKQRPLCSAQYLFHDVVLWNEPNGERIEESALIESGISPPRVHLRYRIQSRRKVRFVLL